MITHAEGTHVQVGEQLATSGDFEHLALKEIVDLQLLLLDRHIAEDPLSVTADEYIFSADAEAPLIGVYFYSLSSARNKTNMRLKEITVLEYVNLE